MLDLGWRQGLHEHISDHVVCGAVYELEDTELDHPVDPVVLDINMLCPGMVLMVVRECNGHLVVWEEGGWLLEWSEDLRDEGVQPECLLAAMYLLSVVESKTISCCLEDHKTVLPLIRNV
jgi:hypothetical protein